MEQKNLVEMYEKVNAICNNKCSAGKPGGGCTMRPESFDCFVKQKMYTRGWWGKCNATACVQWDNVIP